MHTLVLALAALPSPSFLAEPPALVRPRAGSELEAAVDRCVAEHLARPGAVGLSLAIARRGEIVLAKGYGRADLEFDVPADASTCFRIGSVTKQFTAALVMKLVERQQLSLDDDLSKWVPEFPLQGKRVSLRQLLHHTSGIPSYTDLGDEWTSKWPLELSHEELLALVKDKPFDFEPGTRWAYDNTGYYLLGMVLEKASAKSYADLLRDEIARPLGLERTRRDSNVDLIQNRAQGYAWREEGEKGELVNDQPYGTNQPGAAGFLLSTARDLVAWSTALAGGKVVSKESLALMTTPAVLPDGKGTGYGFGLMIDEFEGRKRISHGGGIFGFNSLLAWFPAEDVHVAVISNGEALSSNRVAADVAWPALGIERPALKDLAIPAERLTKLAGVYRVAALDVLVDVTTSEGKLYLQARAPGQGKFRLLWQGEDEFRAEFDRDVKITFGGDGASFRLRQGGGQFDGVRVP